MGFACLACRGDVLVEVDHDDELTPDCVAELAAAFADPRVDFAYSNCCEINDGKPWRYVHTVTQKHFARGAKPQAK